MYLSVNCHPPAICTVDEKEDTPVDISRGVCADSPP